jgi:diacylglycerol O-acyltransferase / wax synthase
MKLISPMDSMFLIGESREHPMHVGGLQLFTPPDGAGPDFIPKIYAAMLACGDIQPAFRKHPAKRIGGFTNIAWEFDDDIDIEYHVRRSALPTPGRARELLELISRLHGSLLDRHRPLWETHVIESPRDGRFAVYTKVHHSLVDGVSALKLMQRSLSTDPGETEIRVPWALPPRQREETPKTKSRARGAKGVLGAFGPSTLSSIRSGLREQQLSLPYRAPRTMLNVPIGGARRCAAQSWSLERIVAVKDAAGATVNDVVLAMCAGALRSYLIDLNALPDTPLIATIPVNVRTENDRGGGNAVSTVLCNLATHLDDPAKRLDAIHTSMQENKKVLAQMPRAQAMALGMLVLALPVISGFLGFRSAAPPPYNITISNVPGSREPLYWNGARLDGNYPLSIALDGQALNITVASSANTLDFGIVGCRRSVPQLQRLLGHLEAALQDLEQAVAV